MEKMIYLRIIGFNNSEGKFQFICLDTDIAVSAETMSGAKAKMKEAITAYFKSFSREGIESLAFERKAPSKYFILWYFFSIVGFVKRIVFFFSTKATYDPHSHNLSLA
ncbi:MAG: hypothetical protein ACHQQQ_14275 [Bacteroidota bacterium]